MLGVKYDLYLFISYIQRFKIKILGPTYDIWPFINHWWISLIDEEMSIFYCLDLYKLLLYSKNDKKMLHFRLNIYSWFNYTINRIIIKLSPDVLCNFVRNGTIANDDFCGCRRNVVKNKCVLLLHNNTYQTEGYKNQWCHSTCS